VAKLPLLPRALEKLAARLAAMRDRLGVAETSAIPDGVTFRQWCEQLAADGLKVDGLPFQLDDRPAMHFIYDMIPSTLEEAFKKTVVLMKCSQVGFTVMEMLAMIYLALKFDPCKIGMYLPGQDVAQLKSSERFLPIIRSIPQAYNRLLASAALSAATPSGKRGGEGNVMTRRMGGSLFYFLHTTGRITTESHPMDALSFDEVQEMKIKDMEKTMERVSASRIKFTLMGSTAKWPDSDIHFFYKKGKCWQFHTACRACGASQIMDEVFPKCIGFDEEAVTYDGRQGDYRYVCVGCGAWIDDAQDGEWIAKFPDARIESIHFTQFLSPSISPREIMEAYLNAEDMMNFYNRKLGKPFMDPSQIPVDQAALNRCVAAGAEAGVKWKDRAAHTFMGIDQMGAFNVVVIKERLPDNRQALIHLEYIYDPDPFARCSVLMDLYGVDICVVEQLPNYNDAKRFAGRHPRRVFTVGSYVDITDGMIRWNDGRKMDANEKHTTEEDRDRWTVSIDQYKAMDVAMKRITANPPILLMPDPAGRVQEVMEKGIMRPSAVLKDVAFLHFQRTALIAERDPEQKKFRRRVVKVGIDPHTSYANMLCDVAWARAHGTGLVILPSDPKLDRRGPGTLAERVEKAMHGVPSHILRMMEEPVVGTCGACQHFGGGNCAERGLRVRAKDIGCILFHAAPK
jgi:hypothetical protein